MLCSSAGTVFYTQSCFLVSDQLYLLHCCHRVGVTLHKSRHRSSLKASRNQRLQTHNTHAEDGCCRRGQWDKAFQFYIMYHSYIKMSDSHQWSSPWASLSPELSSWSYRALWELPSSRRTQWLHRWNPPWPRWCFHPSGPRRSRAAWTGKSSSVLL